MDVSVERYYFRGLAELSSGSETESIYSVQGRETVIIEDSSRSSSYLYSSSDDAGGLEYEVASLSEDDGADILDLSSSELDDFRSTADVIVAALCDSSIDSWATDGEDSDNVGDSSLDSTRKQETKPKEAGSCLICKSASTQFQYCDKCFQQRCWKCNVRRNNPCFPLCIACYKVRKSMFPPRPRGTRKRTKPDASTPTSGSSQPLSQDSGLGSSKDLPGSSGRLSPSRKRPRLDSSTESVDLLDDGKASCGSNTRVESRPDSDPPLASPPSPARPPSPIPVSESSALCIICNVKPRDGIFLHGNRAHMCACYSCSVRTWRTIKECPICRCKVSNVAKVFTS